MKKLVVNPKGWPCTLSEAPAGHIRGTGQYSECMWFKSEYRTAEGKIEAYNEAGEFLCVDPDTIVQPVIFEWDDDE